MDELLIFISYAHEDDKSKDAFIKEFSPAAQNNKWRVWQDGEIKAGAFWDDEVKINLNKAEIIVLLVSSNFLGSDYINNVELMQALEKQKQGVALVIPIILDDCLWEDHDILPKIQAVKANEKIKDVGNEDQKKAALQYAARQVRDSVKAYKPGKSESSKITLSPLKPAEISELRQLDPDALIVAMRQMQQIFLLPPKSENPSQHKLSAAGLPQKVLAILQRLLLKGDLEEDECRVLGEALFHRLFADAASQAAFIKTYQTHAPQNGKPLKIVLHFDTQSNDLARLPWEYLWLPLPEGAEEGFFIGEKENLVLTRRLSTAVGGQPKKVEADKLRILVAYSKPGIQEIAQRIEADAKGVFSRSQPKKEEDKKLWVNIKVAEPQEFKSKKAFEDFIKNEPAFHLVHFIGAGKTEKEKSLIAFCDGKKEEWLTPDELVKCFPDDKKPNLIFLHAPPDSCSSLRDMALNLVTSVDGVLAIQTPVKSEEAADFSEKLYTALAQGEDLDQAVVRAARAAAAKSANRLRMYGISAYFSRATLKMEVAKPAALPSDDVLISYLACPNWDKTGIECKEKIGLKGGGRPTRLFCDNEKCNAGPLWQCPNCNNLIILSKKLCPRCGYEIAKIQLPNDVRNLLPAQAGEMLQAPKPGGATDRAAHNPQESRRAEPGLPR